MTPDKKKIEIANKMDAIMDGITAIDRKRKELEAELMELLPIKTDEKVSIVRADDESHIRYAFIQKIKVDFANERRGARLTFELQKCKKDGVRSYQTDWLRHGQECIKKIK